MLELKFVIIRGQNMTHTSFNRTMLELKYTYLANSRNKPQYF